MEHPPIESSTERYPVPVITADEYYAVDGKLNEALNTIEMSRQMLSSTWSALTYYKAMNNRLYASYNELTGELEEKSGQYSDLLIDWEQNYNHMSAQEARIRQLEQNRKHMEEEHQRALVFAADRISAAERKLTELQHQQGTITQQQPPKRTRRPRRKTLQGKDDVQGKDNVQGKDDGGVDVYSKALDRACETARPRDCTAVETQQNKDDGRTNMQGQTFDRAFETVHVEAE